MADPKPTPEQIERAREHVDSREPCVHHWTPPSNCADCLLELIADEVARAVEPLVELLDNVEMVMDTAAAHGVESLLAPAYRDSWSETHGAVRAYLATTHGETR